MFATLYNAPRQQQPTPMRGGAPLPEQAELELLRLALNQVDYGLAAVDADSGEIQFVNAPGRCALQGPPNGRNGGQHETGLRIINGTVTTYREAQANLLVELLQRTKSGLRGLLSLAGNGQSAASAVAVLPLAGAQLDPACANAEPPTAPRSFALLVFAKQHACDDSSMALFAREQGLTGTEGQVLAQVCKGLRPLEIATRHGVKVSTVRTQLRSIRSKTGSNSIRDLVQQMSVLPPLARRLTHAQPT
ncbi:MAG: helix-turn-helix transcriptional regulator [Rhodoferax sp.]|nr:helix-turn-helix transcriptional regulator [Rhodoferax sp.]